MSARRGPYQTALKFILDREHFGMKLGLENIGNFLTEAGNPHFKFKSVHIAGTNGKGSTAAYIDSIMRTAGYRVGIFTSPHLVDFRERIRVDGKQINKKYITGFIRRHRKMIEKNKITFFEVCTALAFCYFAYKKVDLAVVETGLGGRLDATNTLLPELSIITDISFDHTNVLGNTLKKIAFEKAGIIKKDRPVLVGAMKPEPRREITRIGQKIGSQVIYQGSEAASSNGKLFNFDYHHGKMHLKSLVSSLPGKHQISNAGLAVTAVLMLKQRGFRAGKNHIRQGLKSTFWPGRFDIIGQKKGPTIILDVGHNPAGIKAMTDCFKNVYPGRRADIIFGSVRHKNIEESAKNIISIAKSIELVRLNTDRGVDPNEVAPIFRKNGFSATISDSVLKSVKRIIDSALSDDILIICGSHFLVGEFLESRKDIYGRESK